MLNLNLRGLMALTMAAAVSLVGCKKEEAKPAEGAAPAAAAAPAEGADAAAAAPAGGTENLTKARAMVDKMAESLNKMVADVEAAGNDTAKIKEIGENFKKNGESMKSEGEALQKVLTDDEKKTLETYGREKIGPLMGKLMAAMMKAQAAQAPGGVTPTAAPAGAAPAAAPAPGAAPAPAAAPTAPAAK